ncbi:multifunctional 2',3'-cyclic-nucleotide 2'-phosphodiesterase/5'-nucleotidase/3'-nucleotidase [Duganella sp. Leaf61]|uniref:bifunctional metallophosphatase/5'-nucleotidase n=1 Tax=Duganella sp. Leaf61 TaxID=1736227 RepID=UPI0006FEE576|nr:bifunctional metallophosphatase/5'-nucleotidase [Duganella sp. Leaf61]KQN79184.1 multifunctional 2',3'-cyclic-nucleotide 2'-phosphodiesterase/5'-nucleotidase/3'-nucleotidase [Duganella sp. Leaf61]
MNLSLRPVAAIVLAACLAASLSACSTRLPAPSAAPVSASVATSNLVQIELVTLNDFHGNLEPSKYVWDSVKGGGPRTIEAGGIDTIGAALQAWRRDDPQLLLVGAGDLVGASPAISSMWADEPTIGAMNLLGLRASSVGNHEFDAGRVELLRQQMGGCKSPRADKACKYAPDFGGAKFSYLAANVIDTATRKPVLPAYKIETAHGVKVAFIGTVLKSTAEAALASGIAGLEFIDEADAINRQLPELRQQGVGVFVALVHQGGSTVEKFDQPDCSKLTGPVVDIVKRLDPAVRLVVSGHSHKGYLCQVDGRTVTQSDMGGHVLGRIALTVETQTNTLKDIRARQEVMVPGKWPKDPQLAAYLETARERSAALLAQPVARLAVPSVVRKRADSGESALGDLVADSVLQAGRPFGVQIGFMNNGGMRQDLDTDNGRASVGQTRMVLPFGNTLVVMNLKGWQILDLLEQQWSGGREDIRGLLQVSEGFTYQWDARRGDGSKVVPGSARLNGKPLDREASYRVMVNNFLAEGGDGFPMFANGRNRTDTGIRDIDALNDYLVKREQAGKPAGAAQPQQRYQRLQ